MFMKWVNVSTKSTLLSTIIDFSDDPDGMMVLYTRRGASSNWHFAYRNGHLPIRGYDVRKEEVPNIVISISQKQHQTDVSEIWALWICKHQTA